MSEVEDKRRLNRTLRALAAQLSEAASYTVQAFEEADDIDTTLHELEEREVIPEGWVEEIHEMMENLSYVASGLESLMNRALELAREVEGG